MTLKKYRPLTFVPLAAITIGPHNLQVDRLQGRGQAAPDIKLRGDEVSTADESALYHYQLNYTPPDTERGRRLARR